MTTAASRVLGVAAPPPLSQLQLATAPGEGAETATLVAACTLRATRRGDARGIIGVEVPTSEAGKDRIGSCGDVGGVGASIDETAAATAVPGGPSGTAGVPGWCCNLSGAALAARLAWSVNMWSRTICTVSSKC